MAEPTALISAQQPSPPRSQKRPRQLETHGHVRTDVYYWLNNRQDAVGIHYLNQEDDYTLWYSPYDKITERAHPNFLVTSGLDDSQVQYWEPAKWVGKLRDHWRGDHVLLLKTNMEAGHGGASGRFDQYKIVALRRAFLLKLQGISN